MITTCLDANNIIMYKSDNRGSGTVRHSNRMILILSVIYKKLRNVINCCD
jgi:hypothetical protein